MARHKPQIAKTPDAWTADDDYAASARALLEVLPHRDDEEGVRILADALRQEATRRPLPSIAQRLEQAKAKLEAAETVAMSCYWQGAVDALEAYSRGIAHETTAIGEGVKES